MGSPKWESDRLVGESPHQVQIGRSIAISTKEVTKKEFLRFLRAPKKHSIARTDIERYSQTDDSPQVVVIWHSAAQYCNWLSQTEGIAPTQWCYIEDANPDSPDWMQPAPNFLSRTGYRLPTEAEWEYACRSGSASSRYFGDDAALLKYYEWTGNNSPGGYARPTGQLKPNDFGLFDMLGNVREWCNDAFHAYPKGTNDTVVNDVGDKTPVDSKALRVIRGASYAGGSSRSASRSSGPPSHPSFYTGFRPVRTYP
jgi:formylglycine-generating enzyme required for sulfatase activity